MTAIELIDTHIHLDDARFDDDRDQTIARAAEQGIRKMVVPATTRRSWPKIQAITNSYPEIYPAYGLHPLFLDEHSHRDLPELETLANRSRCIAIGECGLDRYRIGKSRQSTTSQSTPSQSTPIRDADPAPGVTEDSIEIFKRQVFYFEAQLNLAAKLDLPVIVHALQAVEDVILSIKKQAPTQGVVHSFNGSLQQADQLINLGYRLSFGGAATYPRAKKIRTLIQLLPAESILIETDAPDQSGSMHHGHRNEPSYLPEVLRTVAQLRGESMESTANQCNKNAKKLFKID